MSGFNHEAAKSPSECFLAYAREHDRAVLDALLREHLDAAHAQAMRMLGNHSDAEDAIQDALLKLVRTADRYDGTVPFGAWLGRLVHTAAIDTHRSRTRRHRREAVVRATAPASGGDTAEQADLIRQELAGLAEAYRLPLDLHYLSGMSLEQTATALGIDQALVRKRIQRGKEQLVERLRRRGMALAPALLLGLLATPGHAAPSPALIAVALGRAAQPAPLIGWGGIAISGIAALAIAATALAFGFVNADGPAKASAVAVAPGAPAEAAVAPAQAAPPPITAEAAPADDGTTPIRMSRVLHGGGFAYQFAITFPAPDSNAAPATSHLRLFENGIELGPPHSLHADIRNLGAGRLSHWYDRENVSEVLIFSTSDNSDPRTNGRRYAYGLATPRRP